jgi:tRNA dimethylallyltransferase
VQPGELPPLIVICGPTATGKTGLSLELAERLPGAEIISADSRQVYRGMDVGTAKVGGADRARVPHHGLDLVDPDEAFTAADFRRDAMAALAGIGARGGVALLVGGTGLYVRAVARGLPLDATGRDPALRADLEARHAADGLPLLVAELRRVAPTVAAETDLANPRRVIRALERAAVTGDRPPPAATGYPAPVLWLGLSTEPEDHTRWIVERVRSQFEHGLVEEAADLRARYPEDLRAFSAVGYREAFDLLAGRLDRDAAIARTVARTRSYAKRQRTWFRAEPDVRWLPTGEGSRSSAARESVAAFLAAV